MNPRVATGMRCSTDGQKDSQRYDRGTVAFRLSFSHAPAGRFGRRRPPDCDSATTVENWRDLIFVARGKPRRRQTTPRRAGTSVPEGDRQFRLIRVHHEHREELGRLRLAGIGADAVAVAGSSEKLRPTS